MSKLTASFRASEYCVQRHRLPGVVNWHSNGDSNMHPSPPHRGKYVRLVAPFLCASRRNRLTPQAPQDKITPRQLNQLIPALGELYRRQPTLDCPRHLCQTLYNLSWNNDRTCARLHATNFVPLLQRTVMDGAMGVEQAMKLLRNLVLNDRSAVFATALRQQRELMQRLEEYGSRFPGTSVSREARALQRVLQQQRPPRLQVRAI